MIQSHVNICPRFTSADVQTSCLNYCSDLTVLTSDPMQTLMTCGCTRHEVSPFLRMCSWSGSQHHHKALECEQTSPSSWNKLKISHATRLRFLDNIHLSFLFQCMLGLSWQSVSGAITCSWVPRPKTYITDLLKIKGQNWMCICYWHGLNDINKNQSLQRLHLEPV